MKVKQGFTFDDLLLVPQYSKILSRKDVSLDVDLGKGIKLKCPIVSANMMNITGVNMAKAILAFGGLPILHRFASIDEQQQMFLEASKYGTVGCSVGVQEEDFNNVNKFVDHGCKVICVDVAHGDSAITINMVERIAELFPRILLIAGNVATAGGAKRLYEAGADVIKLGIGSGSTCSTRIETGNGVPQMTALHNVFMEACYNNFSDRSFKIIADGGIRRAGDCVKSLCFSDAVMLGSVLAGTDEAPGEIIVDAATGQRYKQYAGSSTHKTNHIEGIIARVKCKGPIAPIITTFLEGIRSGLSYQGCSNLEELKDNPEFIQITNSGLIESHPHINNR